MSSSKSGLSLLDFLPAYSNINASKQDQVFSFYSSKIPPSTNQEFYPATFLKKEFNDLQLPRDEPPRDPSKGFEPLNQQSFVTRFLSPYTPYDKLLVYHGVGVGKTCLASLLAETSQAINLNLLQTLILVRNEVLYKNFVNEIATTCTNNKYKPSAIDPKTKQKITEEQYIRRLNKNISTNYQIETFERFAKELAANDDDYIREVYSNRIIVIDEAHNLRLQPKEQSVSIYKQIFRLLHIIQNCKVILMTATPMRDQPDEVAGLLNLLLPDNASSQFDKDIFTKHYFNGVVFKDSLRTEFKTKIRGLVSYLRSSNANVKHIIMGKVITNYLGSTQNGMKKIPLEAVSMSPIQNKSYEEAYTLDKKNAPPIINEVIEDNVVADDSEDSPQGSSGLYKYSRQASMFVAPDGSYGEQMEKKWLVIPTEEKREPPVKCAKKEKRIVKPLSDRLTRVTNKLKEWIYNDKVNPSDKEKLERLRLLSPKFAGVIEQLINYPTEKAFVYSNLVAGAGTNLFGAILELFQFNHSKLPEGPERQKANLERYKGNRNFILITSKFPTAKQADFLVNKIYNNPENKYGQYIQVIVASKIVGEGLSFKHTRQFHDLTPGWNETELQQAEGRVIRAFAHDIFEDPAEKFIKLFRWCAMPIRKDFPSIDFFMYKLSEDKDYPIKQIERLLQESAVDCALNSKRNMRSDLDQDGSRNCSYSSCTYSCEDIPDEWYQTAHPKHPALITDSYNLYYAQNQIADIKKEIKLLYKIRFMYDFKELVNLLPQITELIIIRALKEIIDQSIPIINKYGITSYLVEDKNLYFLIDNPEVKYVPNSYLLAIYNIQPILKDEMSFKDYVSYFEDVFIDEKFRKLSTLANQPDPIQLSKSFRSFSLRIQEQLLESFISAQEQGVNTNVKLRQSYLDVYKGSITTVGDRIISSLLLDDLKILRCYNLQSQQWSDCIEEDKSIFQETIIKNKELISENPYGYSGIIDTAGNFKIVTHRKGVRLAEQTGKIDRRVTKAKGEGQVCGTGKAFDASKLRMLLLLFGEIAESLGTTPPSISDKISRKDNQNITPTQVEKKLTSLLSNLQDVGKNKKNKSSIEAAENEAEKQMITKTLAELEQFSQDKLRRWNSILTFGNVVDVLCPTIREFLDKAGLLIRK